MNNPTFSQSERLVCGGHALSPQFAAREPLKEYRMWQTVRRV